MSPRPPLGGLFAAILAAGLTISAGAADQSGLSRLRALVPRKVASEPLRARECVQKSPDFVLWDADKKITPGAVGYVYYLEQSRDNRLLLRDQNEGARGWTHADSIVPISRAEEYFSRQIELNPRSAFAFLMRGVVRLENEDLEHALGDLDESLKLDQNSAAAHAARAYLWLWKGRLDQAIADATRAIELDPKCAYPFVERGIFYYNLHEYEQALHDLDAAVERGFHGALIEVARGMIDLHRGNIKKAREEFAEALRLDPKHPDAYAGAASIYMMRGDTTNALKVLNQAVEIDPQSPDSHGNRAIVLISARKYEKALDDLDDVLRVAPNSVRALRERAWILATCTVKRIRNGEEAQKSAARACELTGWNEPHALLTLAAGCAEAGNFDEAVKWQQAAIELLGEKDREKREHKRILERYRQKKPYYQLSLLEEMGLPRPRPAANKSD